MFTTCTCDDSQGTLLNLFQVSCKINQLDVKITQIGSGIVFFKFDDFYASDNLTDKRSLLRYDASYKEASSR